MPPILGLVISYLLGSIPSAYIAGRLFRGIDLRQHGSGNLGATNVYRVMGARIASLVMAFDVAKGAVPVLLLPGLTASPYRAHWALAYGLAAILGHVRSVYFLWRSGGKGVATAAGVFLALAPIATLVAFVIWGAVLWGSGYVSLASLCAAVALPLGVAVTEGARSPVLAASVLVCLFVFWTHRANIGRLRRGEEHRFGRKKPAV
ncbi:MAG TPA: glycerol-3-phosphate 1-O-acyltransferase PlsY [Gemmatimonadaceae bacterium]|nr:glycerol-3-phosphate 1-O-acyltransferase PlsY [Gemmatimonadaceae bacterium]